jgi:transcriptional regulator with XRE-family HTH domain
MKEITILGENLKKLRKSHGLTQQQVADILKIKRSTYAYYEHGVNPGNENIRKLAAMFSVSTHALVYGSEEEVAEKPLIFNDSNTIFITPDTDDATIPFDSLNYQEKMLISYMRMLPITYKEKLLNEAAVLLEKYEEE